MLQAGNAIFRAIDPILGLKNLKLLAGKEVEIC